MLIQDEKLMVALFECKMRGVMEWEWRQRRKLAHWFGESAVMWLFFASIPANLWQNSHWYFLHVLPFKPQLKSIHLEYIISMFHIHRPETQEPLSYCVLYTNPAFSEIHSARATSHTVGAETKGRGAVFHRNTFVSLLPAPRLSLLLRALFNRFSTVYL